MYAELDPEMGVTPKVVLAKSGPGTTFLAAKSGPPSSLLAAEIGPPLPNTVPLFKTLVFVS